MKMSTLPLLLVAMMALTRAADTEAGNGAETGGEMDVFKRTYHSECPWGWSKYGQRCFHFVPREMTWSDALTNCWSMGANLASVHDAGEYHWIQKLIADRSHAHPLAYIGGTDMLHEGHWRWTDGSPFLFSYWCHGEPNNAGWQHCLQMNYTGNKCWADVWCHFPRASVCAKKI
ncbi:type-2 ice-structuring protein-like isoform X2 [Melanotaenia boesemani]|uniref:type-2 ice-structuring protein-like isoform X2 n=1 Tax=Melanotaenia boesemani TaxID=1250792 RepID=UPI001C05CC29|nr:type-2 ice-structuring protein-like isoform X2 [Melanotaenia boesemani]